MKEAFIIFAMVLLASCDYKEAPVRIPVKPYVVINKFESGSTGYTIVIVDSKMQRFTFDVEFFNEDKYHLGDSIK